MKLIHQWCNMAEARSAANIKALLQCVKRAYGKAGIWNPESGTGTGT